MLTRSELLEFHGSSKLGFPKCEGLHAEDEILDEIPQRSAKNTCRKLPGGALMQAAGRVHDGPEKGGKQGRDG